MEKENKKGKQAYKGARHKIHSEISYNSSKTNSMFLKLQSNQSPDSQVRFSKEDGIKEEMSSNHKPQTTQIKIRKPPVSKKLPQVEADCRDFEILLRKFISNLNIQIQQTFSLIKLDEMVSLQNEGKQLRKLLMETQIYVRKLRIRQRHLTRSKTPQSKFQAESDRVKPYKKNKYTYLRSHLKSARPTTQLKKLLSSERSEGTQKVQQGSKLEMRKQLLLHRIGNLFSQIQLKKEALRSEQKLLEEEIQLLVEEKEGINEQLGRICCHNKRMKRYFSSIITQSNLRQRSLTRKKQKFFLTKFQML